MVSNSWHTTWLILYNKFWLFVRFTRNCCIAKIHVQTLLKPNKEKISQCSWHWSTHIRIPALLHKINTFNAFPINNSTKFCYTFRYYILYELLDTSKAISIFTMCRIWFMVFSSTLIYSRIHACALQLPKRLAQVFRNLMWQKIWPM